MTQTTAAQSLGAWLKEADRCVSTWEARWGPYEPHPSLRVDHEALSASYEAYVNRLTGNYPFFHPRYAGQMLKPPHPVAILGYLTAMRINPNNHALDGGPPTAAMEKEVVIELAKMFEFPENALGHLTSSGTIANLEALFVSREEHPDKTIAVSQEAHYTHARMGHVLGVSVENIAADTNGRIDLEALEKALRSRKIGTVVLTAGTTGLGTVDSIAEAIPLCRQYDVRVHVDAAYGGFFRLLSRSEILDPVVARNLDAIKDADSIVLDPHKHGLQPYGCGCILYRDPTMAKHYLHDSPYTYFTSEDLHLGEISLECSRAGAAAGALWLTLQLLPLSADEGLGPILSSCLEAAQRWHAALEDTPLRSWGKPELDIACYYPEANPNSASAIDRASQALFENSMASTTNPVFLSVLRVQSADLRARMPDMEIDQESVRILRSVLMRPEQANFAESLVDSLVGFVQSHVR
ncbi:MAG: aspartate aminotransferase family protein [Rhodothermaceae bacterium]|nr:aspartate aminotransferase family protein [Rhodothermaceae bacterium]MYE63412.1 aspartate aminotransferase family protein [Rhodothermaceae bacterium]MYJ19822.1 aspartate aminotransferase family protein [Rhodothermaceae bacterium]